MMLLRLASELSLHRQRVKEVVGLALIQPGLDQGKVRASLMGFIEGFLM